MNKHNLKFVLLLACGMMTHYACRSQMSEEVNIPEAGFNGGFETVSQHLPVNWILYTPKTVKEGSFKMRMDTTDFTEGKQSLMFDVKECSDKGGRYSPGISKEWQVQSGATYQITLKVKIDQSRIRTRIHAVSAKKSGNVIAQEQTDISGGWKILSYEYTVPSDYTRLRLELNILSAGVVKLDDISVKLIRQGR